MKYILLLLFISLALSFPVASHAEDANDDSIQGTWYLSGQVDNKDGHGLSWFLEWTFNHNKFNLSGYPPLHQEGSYRIVKTEGNKLTLELYDQKGNFGTENSQIEIVVNKENDTLTIKDQGPFTRAKAKSSDVRNKKPRRGEMFIAIINPKYPSSVGAEYYELRFTLESFHVSSKSTFRSYGA